MLILRLLQAVAVWIFTALFVTSVVVFSLLTLGRFRLTVGRRLVRGWGRVVLALLGVRLRVEGAEHLTGRAPRIMIVNHASALDFAFLAATVPPAGVPVVARSNLKIPFVGTALRALGSIPISRGDTPAAREILAQSADRIQKERLTVIIAPEGGRSRDGKLRPFKKGALWLALSSRAPIVPMVIHGGFEVLPPGQWRVEPRTVRIRVLEPISSGNLTPETMDETLAELEELFRSTLESLGAPAGGVSRA